MSSKAPIGLLNPVFSKQTNEENNQTELVMDDLSSVEGATSVDPNVNTVELNISTVFSSNIADKDKSKKTKKAVQKKKGCFSLFYSFQLLEY